MHSEKPFAAEIKKDMNDLGIKGSLISDSATQGPNGRDGASALAGLANSFQELVGKARFRIEDGLTSWIDNASISSESSRPEPANHADDYGRDNADTGRDDSDHRDRFDNEARNNDTGEDRSGEYRAEKDDGYARENGAEHRDDQGDNQGDNHAQDDGAEHGDNSQAQEEGDDNEDPSTDQQASDDAGQEDGGDDHSSTETAGENQTAGDENKGPGDTAQTTLVTNEILTSLVAGGEALVTGGKASEQGKASSADGIAKAASKISSTGTEKAADQGTENASQTAGKNISKTTPTSSGQNKGGQGEANASDQAKSVANEQSAIIAGTDAGEEALSNINAQAAGLAKAIGDGNRAQVTVTVNNESQNLISKPGQALTPNALLSKESGSQQANSQNTNANSQGNSQNPTAQAQVQLAETPQAQNQGAQGAQAGGGAKGLAQVSSVSTGSATTTHAGGGESTTQFGGSNATQQTQSQSATNQTETAQKTFRPGNSMVEQISVKITKAIQSGQDKITIQLRPANMCRVEVKMEVSHDNRLTALVTVDNRETLDQLKNDSRSLQRALQDAGLQTDAGDLQFNMRGQEGQGQEAKASPDRLSFGDDDLAILEAEIIDQPLIADDGTIISNGRVDVRA